MQLLAAKLDEENHKKESEALRNSRYIDQHESKDSNVQGMESSIGNLTEALLYGSTLQYIATGAEPRQTDNLSLNSIRRVI